MNEKDLKALGTGNTAYSFDEPMPELLERFKTPFITEGIDGTVEITCPEFTSLCPITNQPDFATIIIEYTPDEWCVESKSLKLYLMGFRNHGEFHESCVNKICTDLVDLLDPKQMKVKGEFTPRGGIPFWPTATWNKKVK